MSPQNMLDGRYEKKKLTNCRNCGDDLTKLELVQDGGLTSSIKTNHQNSHLFLGKKPAEKLRECQPHLFGFRSLYIPTLIAYINKMKHS